MNTILVWLFSFK